MDNINTANDFFVGVGFENGEMVYGFTLPPIGRMDQETALRTAAWLVALADPMEERFPAILAAVKNT